MGVRRGFHGGRGRRSSRGVMRGFEEQGKENITVVKGSMGGKNVIHLF